MPEANSSMDDATIDFLAIGAVTRDLLQNDPTCGEYALGGTVSFAAVTARRLGYQPAVVTRAATDVDLSPIAVEAALTVLPSPTTTTFANIYTEEGRVQYVYTPVSAITAADLPDRLRQTKITLLGPLVNEITPDVAAFFPDETLVAAVPQGWMRRWDADGLVHPIPWQNAVAFLVHLDVLILSIEDIGGDLSQIDRFLQHVPLVVVTQYREGSTIYQRRQEGIVQRVHVPPRKAREVDPTGAGDIYATAFLLRYQETGDPLQAARFANITASFGVEGIGIEAIPSQQKVMDYMIEHPWPVEEKKNAEKQNGETLSE